MAYITFYHLGKDRKWSLFYHTNSFCESPPIPGDIKKKPIVCFCIRHRICAWVCQVFFFFSIVERERGRKCNRASSVRRVTLQSLWDSARHLTELSRVCHRDEWEREPRVTQKINNPGYLSLFASLFTLQPYFVHHANTDESMVKSK